MRQFFAEALMIVAMGATLGLLLSLGLVAALGGLPIKEFVGVPTISPAVLVATLTLLALVAFAAGVVAPPRAPALRPGGGARRPTSSSIFSQTSIAGPMRRRLRSFSPSF